MLKGKRERAGIVWMILAAAGCIAAVVFIVLFVCSALLKNAKEEFPVDLSGLSVRTVRGADGKYAVGTDNGEVLLFDEASPEAPYWTYQREAEGTPAAVADIALHGEELFVAYSDRYIYSFRPAEGETPAVERRYRVELTPQTLFLGEGDLFAVYGATAAYKGLYLFRADDPAQDVSYRDNPYLDRANGLGDGLTCALIDGDDTVYFCTETSQIVKITLNDGRLDADSVETVYAGDNDFISMLATEDGFAAIDRFSDIYHFDREMTLQRVDRGEDVTITAAFPSGSIFVTKVKNGGILGMDADDGRVFSVTTPFDSLIVFASEEGFAYLTHDGGSLVYLGTQLAARKALNETLYYVWLALLLVFTVFTVFAVLCVFGKTRRRVGHAFGVFGKTVYKHRVAYLSLVPTFLLLAVFYWYPIVSSLVLSFFDYLPKEKMVFVGIDNIVSVARNTEFWFSFKNTLIFLVSDLVKAIIPPILFAEFLLSLKSRRTSYWIRTIMFLPGVIPGVASMLVWADGIFGSSSSGLLNGFLSLFVPNFVSKPWLMDKSYAIFCMIAIGFPWVGSYLIFFGAISGLPKEMFEAAKLDGCGWWRRVFSFDIPLILPQIKYIFITTFIGSVQNYTFVYVTTGGDYGTNTPALMMYKAISVQKNYGIASAMGLFLFVFLIGATAINFRMQFGRNED